MLWISIWIAALAVAAAGPFVAVQGARAERRFAREARELRDGKGGSSRSQYDRPEPW